mmetsp:Transcript_3900/g.11665  ORF Transcript_3900/g.11665 Transcript_3900/m.11665 type:complete len:1174 (+) Transcript_3900:161-3682(+)
MGTPALKTSELRPTDSVEMTAPNGAPMSRDDPFDGDESTVELARQAVEDKSDSDMLLYLENLFERPESEDSVDREEREDGPPLMEDSIPHVAEYFDINCTPPKSDDPSSEVGSSPQSSPDNEGANGTQYTALHDDEPSLERTELSSHFLQDVCVEESQLSVPTNGLAAVYLNAPGSSVSLLNPAPNNTEEGLSTSIGESIVSSAFGINLDQSSHYVDQETELPSCYYRQENTDSNGTSPPQDGRYLHDYARKLLGLEKKMHLMELKNAELAAENTKLHSSLKETSKFASADQDSKVAGEIQSLRIRLQSEEAQRSVVENENEALRETLVSKERIGANLQSELAVVKAEHSSLHTALEKARRSFEEVALGRQDDEQKIAELTETVSDLKIVVEEKDSALKDQAAAIDTLRLNTQSQQEADVVSEKLQSLLFDLESSQQECNSLQYRIEVLEGVEDQVSEVQRQADELSCEKKQLEDQLNKASVDLAHEKKQCLSLQQELDDALNDAKSKADQLSYQSLQLQEATEKARVESIDREQQVKDYIERLSEKFAVKAPEVSPLVEQLIERIEELIVDRRTCQEKIEYLQTDLASKSEVLQAAEARVADMEALEVEQLRETNQRLQNDVDSLVQERDRLEEQLGSELSFCEPSMRESDSSCNENVEALVQIVADLQEANQDLQSQLDTATKKSDGCDACVKELNHCHALSGKERELNRLRLDAAQARADSEEAIAVLRSHGEGLQELLKHEMEANSEMRCLLDENERSSRMKLENVDSELRALRDSKRAADMSNGRHVTWLRGLLRTLDCAPVSESTADQELQSSVTETCERLKKDAALLARTSEKAAFFEEQTAALRIQKRTILQIYASRAELPPGLPYTRERKQSALERFRAAALTVVAVTKLRAVGSRQMFAADTEKHFSCTVSPPVWHSYTECQGVSAGAAMKLLPQLERAVRERDEMISSLETSLSASELRLLKSHSEDQCRRQMIEMERVRQRLVDELAHARLQTILTCDELNAKLAKAVDEADEAKAKGLGEREARHAAEARVRKYVRRLDEYVEALQKSRAENYARERLFITRIGQMTSRKGRNGKQQDCSNTVETSTAAAVEKENFSSSTLRLSDESEPPKPSGKLSERCSPEDNEEQKTHEMSLEKRSVSASPKTPLTSLANIANILND